jgi:hypothetical protein
MADTIEIIQGTATTVEVAGPTGPQGPAGAAGATGSQGPQGVPGTGLEVLTTQGDLLYQGASTGQRLAIGTSGQVLKVANGIPAWGNESGAVTSVNGETGAVTLDGSEIDSSANDVRAAFTMGAFGDGNGIYYPLPDTTLNSKRVYRATSGHHVFFQSLRWHITDGSPITANIIESSDDDNAAWPWLSAWSGDVDKAKLADVVGRARSTFLFVGDSVPNTSVSGLGTAATVDSTAFAAASHTHGNLTNAGAIGTTANLPLKTGTNGVIEAGSFGTSAGSFCEGNDARLSDARTPSSTLAHAASHAAGVKASSNVQVGGVSMPVLVRANAAGTAGNSITLTFNGSQSIINRLSAWNSANPSNQATLIWGDGSQIPENGAGFTLSGGVAGGSDPIPSFSQLAVNDGNGVSLVSLNGASSDIIEFESEELTFQHTGGSGTPYISVTDESNNEALLGLRQGEMFLQGSNPNVRIEQGGGGLANILMASAKLVDELGFDEQGPYTATIDVQEQLSDDVTLTIPDQSGTLAVVTDIPTTAGDIGAAASGSITTSGLTQATARI